MIPDQLSAEPWEDFTFTTLDLRKIEDFVALFCMPKQTKMGLPNNCDYISINDILSQ